MRKKILYKIMVIILANALLLGNVVWAQDNNISSDILSPEINLTNKTIQLAFLSVESEDVKPSAFPPADEVKKQERSVLRRALSTGAFIVTGALIIAAIGFLTGCSTVPLQGQQPDFSGRFAERKVVDIEYENIHNYVKQFLNMPLEEEEYKRIKTLKLVDVIYSPQFRQFIQDLRGNDYDLEGIENVAVLKLAQIFNDWKSRERVFSKGFREFGQFLQNEYGINVLDDFTGYIKIYYNPILLRQYKDGDKVDTFKKAKKQFGRLKYSSWSVSFLQTIRAMESWEEKLQTAKNLNIDLIRQFSGLEEVTSLEQVRDLMNLGEDQIFKDTMFSEKAKNIYQVIGNIWPNFKINISGSYGVNAELKTFAWFVRAFHGRPEDLAHLKDYGIILVMDHFSFSSEVDINWLLFVIQRPGLKEFYKNCKLWNPGFNFGNSLQNLNNFVLFALHPQRDEFLKFYAQLEKQKISVFDLSDFVEIIEKDGIETLKILLRDYPKMSYSKNNDSYLLTMANVRNDLLSERTKSIYRILIDKYELEKIPFGGRFSGFTEEIKEHPDFLAVLRSSDFQEKYYALREHYGFENEFGAIMEVYEMYKNNKAGIDVLLSTEGLRGFKFFSGMSDDKIYYFFLDEFAEFIQSNGVEILELLRFMYGFGDEGPRVDLLECKKLAEDKNLFEQLKTKKTREFFRKITQKGVIACSKVEELEAIAKLSELENARIVLTAVKRLGFKRIISQVDEFMRLLKQKDAVQNLLDPAFVSFYEKCKQHYLSLDPDLKDLRYICVLYSRILATDNSEELLNLMLSDACEEIVETIKRDYHLNFITGDMLLNILELIRDFDKEKISELKQYAGRKISANDLILLHEVSKNDFLTKLFKNKELLIANAKRIYAGRKPLIRTTWGSGPRKGYSESPDPALLDTVALMRLYLLDKLLDDPDVIAVLTSIVRRDLADMTTEYGGHISLKKGKVWINNIKSISEDNGSYSTDINMFFSGGIMTFHFHATEVDDSEFAGPSGELGQTGYGDWRYVEVFNNTDVIFTAGGFDDDGKLKLNVDMYYIDHNGIPVVIDTRSLVLPLRKTDIENSNLEDESLNRPGARMNPIAPIVKSLQGLPVKCNAISQSI